MKKQRLYLDTSVYGGLYDEEFKEYTKPLFDRIKNFEFEVIYSNVTGEELENAPKKIRDTIKQLPNLSSITIYRFSYS